MLYLAHAPGTEHEQVHLHARGRAWPHRCPERLPTLTQGTFTQQGRTKVHCISTENQTPGLAWDGPGTGDQL